MISLRTAPALAAIALTAACSDATAPATAAAPQPDLAVAGARGAAEERILYGNTPPGGGFESDITSMKTNGGGVAQLTAAPLEDHAPSWSADYKRIAFLSKRNGSRSIFVMNADGSGQTQVTTAPLGKQDTWPHFSPDGNRLVFQSDRTGNNELYVVNVDGTNLTQITDSPGYDSEPIWGVDGRIYFSCNWFSTDPYVYNICSVNPAGGDAKRHTTAQHADRHPRLSPSGKALLFDRQLRDGSNGREIRMVGVAGGAETLVISSPAGAPGAYAPAWSRDGKKMAYTLSNAFPATASAIMVYDFATGASKQLTAPGTGYNSYPAWAY
jgi:Tol biopolymer transport system component